MEIHPFLAVAQTMLVIYQGESANAIYGVRSEPAFLKQPDDLPIILTIWKPAKDNCICMLMHRSGMLECNKAYLLTTCSIMSVLVQSDDADKGEGHDAIALASS